jgi:hypothetical protein
MSIMTTQNVQQEKENDQKKVEEEVKAIQEAQIMESVQLLEREKEGSPLTTRTKFFTVWMPIMPGNYDGVVKDKNGKLQYDTARSHNFRACDQLSHWLNERMMQASGKKLVSMTSTGVNGMLVTTIAYEETQQEESGESRLK